jgi:hypothetical protein
MSSGNRFYKPQPAALRLIKPQPIEDNFDPDEAYEDARRRVYRMYELEQRIEELDTIAAAHTRKVFSQTRN